jgi:pimeloyl-ACP methyl ester carboxylesterase
MRVLRSGILFSLLFAVWACDSADEGNPVLAAGLPARERPASTLSWQPCGNLECATLDAPIDYDDPSVGTVSLALNRARANAAQGYRGTVLINPGGPGVSGKVYLANAAPLLRTYLPGFDFVGFDPRGVGESDGLGCVIADAEVNAAFQRDGAQGFLQVMQRESRRCAREEGPLFDNMGSNQVVADIDRMRAALGEDEINFIGISYATRLGELYALMYPEHTRALVLDGAVTPVPDVRRQVESQFVALLDLQESFFDDCEANVLDCPPEPEAVFEAMFEEDDPAPLVQVARGLWKLLLASAPGRELAATSLRVQAGEVLTQLPGMPDPGEVLGDFNTVANVNINCADDTTAPLSPAAAQALLATYAQRSRRFAGEGVPALTCSGWEVESDPVPSIEFAPRVPPLVIGGTRDILTPYALAEETAQLMDGAALLTSEHYGHSALNLGLQSCVFGHVRRYLETLQLPPAGARCEPPPAP